RDHFALTWISHHYALRVDHLQVLLGQQKGRELSQGTVSKLASRWYHAGWADLRRFRVGEPPWVWPTEEGLSTIGSGYPYRDFNEDYTLPRQEHLAAINDIHLQTSADWMTHRQLFRDVASEYESIHEPDGEIHLPDGNVIAVKAQVWAKQARVMEKNLVKLLQ